MTPLDEVRSVLKKSRRVRVLTGAGVSAESGVPTFRGQDGLWRQFKPEELATPEAFDKDPRLVWEWYDWRRALISKARPNPGHDALVELERLAQDFCLITQNVDGLHDLAGSKRVLHLHGDIWTLRCLECGKSFQDRTVPLPDLPPGCRECGGMLRPGVVWFGESLPQDVLVEAMEASRDCDLFLVVGTKAAVQPAASLALMAKERKAFVVEIDPEPSEIAGAADIALRGPAGKVLPQLLAKS